jgi:hypothetical protein
VTLALLVLLILSAAAPAPPQSSQAPGLLASAEKEAAKESTNNEPAKAQEPEAGPKRTRLQLGVSLKSTVTPGIDTADSVGPTFIWRWRGKGSRTDDRWAPAYRLSSFSSRVSSQLGSRELPVGDVKLQPLMLGIDYKMPRGKWNWAAGMSAGWSLNNVDTPGAYRDRVINTTGIPDLWVDVHNSFVWGPRLKGWYDVNRRVSFMVESAYLVTRPELDVRANGVITTRRINADAFIVKAGVVYGIF